MDRLFVYGTLKFGEPNENALLLAKRARYIGAARIPGRLFRVAHYPALAAPVADDDWVKGDVFEGISSELFAHLDHYEGAEYTRETAEVTMGTGLILAVFVYRWIGSTESLQLIPKGDWTVV